MKNRLFSALVFLFLLACLFAQAQSLPQTITWPGYPGNPAPKTIVLDSTWSGTATIIAYSSAGGRKLPDSVQPTFTRQGNVLLAQFSATATKSLSQHTYVEVATGGIIRFKGYLTLGYVSPTTPPSSGTVLPSIGIITINAVQGLPADLAEKALAITRLTSATLALSNSLDAKPTYGSSIASLTAASRGNLTSFHVNDPVRGGDFTYASSGYTVDNGIVFPAQGGGYWVRQNVERVNVKWFGAAGDNVTNDTLAFSRAIAYIKSIAKVTLLNSQQIKTNPTLYVPKGFYYLPSAHYLITFANFSIQGDGPKSSVLRFTGNTVLFELGTRLTTVPDLFANGFAQDAMFQDLRIANTVDDYHGMDGLRVGTAIRDNGSGGVYMRNIEVAGYAYGFNAPFGSDFTRSENSRYNYNDVGVYLGPGAQQVVWSGGSIEENREGLVIDRAQQGVFQGIAFNDNVKGHIVIEGYTTGTRQLSSVTGNGTSQALSIAFRDCWFESGQMNTHNDDWIVFQGDTPDNYRGVEIDRPHIVAGGGLVSGSAFIHYKHQANNVILSNATYQGNALSYKVKNDYGNTTIENWYTTNGTTEPPDYDFDYLGHSSRSRFGAQNLIKAATQADREVTQIISDNAVRERINSNYQVQWSAKIGGTWYDRFGFDIQNSRLFLGSITSNGLSIDAGSSPPGGTYAAGSFRLNTEATSSAVGWVKGASSWLPVYSFSAVSQLTNDVPYLSAATAAATYVPVTGGDFYGGTVGFSASTTSQVLASFGPTPNTNGWRFQNAGGSNYVQLRGWSAGSEAIRLDPAGGFSYFNGNTPRVGFATTTDNGRDAVQVAGSVGTQKLYGTESLTTISAGAAAGTGPTVSVSGTSMGGTITITTGTSPTTGTLATLTFPTAYANTPFVVVSSSQGSTLPVGTVSSSATGFSIKTPAIPIASTTYSINYTINAQ